MRTLFIYIALVFSTIVSAFGGEFAMENVQDAEVIALDQHIEHDQCSNSFYFSVAKDLRHQRVFVIEAETETEVEEDFDNESSQCNAFVFTQFGHFQSDIHFSDLRTVCAPSSNLIPNQKVFILHETYLL